MYKDYFSLKIKPFQITADPKFLWLGEKHKEALATLKYGILDNRGFLLLTGEVGTGKTVLINRLLTLLDESMVVAALSDPDLESLDFYNILADEFKMDRTFESKGQFLIHFRNFLHQSYGKQQQVLLIIDESQRLNHKAMEDIRTLSNIELHDRKLINIFFVGQPEFSNILMTPENRALSQRITVRYHIEALDENETGDYIRHRLEVAGSKKGIFKKSAISEIYKISQGLPRLINIICDHSLLTAYTRNVTRIDGEIITECAEELRIPLHKPQAEAANFRETDKKMEDGAPTPPVDHSREPVAGSAPQAEPLSFRWLLWLPNLAAVLLIIAVITYFYGRYSGNATEPLNTGDVNLQSNISSSEVEKPLPENGVADGDLQTGDTPIEAEAGAAKTRERLHGDSGVEEAPERSPSLAAEQVSSNQDPAPGTGNAVSDTVAEASDANRPQYSMEGKITIPFGISSNDIDAASYPLLDNIAGYLARYPEAGIDVRGYTDNHGPKGYNESMSLFRANVVKSYLVGKGVYPDRIVIYAMGSANPISPNTSLEGRRKNRRVEIELQ
ncbi:MAG: AAA family ATPase [Desulfobacteraceae bacterium]|jgi:general secretion pathway protein A